MDHFTIASRPHTLALAFSSEKTHQSSGSQSRKPLAKGLLAILSCVICGGWGGSWCKLTALAARLR